jgi:uncharacterized protein
MRAQLQPRIGGILSADIAVPDHERELRFYSQVLSTGEVPLWRQDLMNNLGMPIIGLGARIPEYDGLPVQWMPHIQVAQVADSAQRAVALGGRELMHGKDEAGESQWAVLEDSNGAAFGVVPVVSTEATDQTSDDSTPLGHIAWVDLTVPDASSTRDFYSQVIGWSAQEVALQDGPERYADYSMLGDGGQPSAGVCHARGVNLGLPPVWMIYLPVGDLAESLRRVEQEGGEVIKAAKGDDGGYMYAAVRDPVGACLALVPAG